VAALAWLTGSNALVPLSNGRIIHPSYVGWPFILMLLGIILGGYIYAAAGHESLPIIGRRRTEIDHSFRYSLIFVEAVLNFELGGADQGILGCRVAVRFTNSFNKPIQVYLEDLELNANGVESGPYLSKVRLMRLMPNQFRQFYSPTIPSIPQGYFVGIVKYSVLYGPLDSSTVYRHRHEFELHVTGTKVTIADLQKNSSGCQWYDIEAEVDIDMPEGYEYPRA
jgi:hypothetical protein